MWLKRGGVCVRVLQEDRRSGEEAVPESVCADFNVHKKHFTVLHQQFGHLCCCPYNIVYQSILRHWLIIQTQKTDLITCNPLANSLPHNRICLVFANMLSESVICKRKFSSLIKQVPTCPFQNMSERLILILPLNKKKQNKLRELLI